MKTDTDPRREEWLKCSLSFPYWLDTHGHIYDATRRRWLRFRLWPGQLAVAEALAPPYRQAGEASRALLTSAPSRPQHAGPRPDPLAGPPALPPPPKRDASPGVAGAMRSDPSVPLAQGLAPDEIDGAAHGTSTNASPPPDNAVAARLFVILKARQLGMTWLAVGFALWLMLFRPAATVLLFSKRDDEAVHLLRTRLRGMYERLPAWMRARALEADNDHELALSNGSTALAFPTTGGRSYTATMAIVDEADHTGELDRLLDAVKPTVDAGGWLILLSTADKGEPGSTFKRIYQAARRGENGYVPIFLPWHARPDRTAAWYEAIRRDYLARDGTLDALYGEYPASDVEALAARQSDRRFAAEWLNRIADCRPAESERGSSPIADSETSEESRGVHQGKPEFNPKSTMPETTGQALRNPQSIRVFRLPVEGRRYVIGADPAEGNPQSDESAASVVDAVTGEQMAVLAGRLEPAIFAAGLADAAELYNGADILVERNNHGHAVLLWLVEHKWDWMAGPPASSGQDKAAPVACPGRAAGPGDTDQAAPYNLLRGWDRKPGWLSAGRGKALAFDAAADALRAGATVVRDLTTLEQLMAIRGATLSAPPGERDDRAVAHVLALAALRWCDLGPTGPGTAHRIPARDPIAEADAGGFA